MTNREYLYGIRAEALSSLYWSRKAQNYYSYDVYSYAPMVKDELFKTIADESETIGVIELEKRLGRNIKVEELSVCPLSVHYLLWGTPTITESEQETETLSEFLDLIRNSVRRNETKTINYFIRRKQVEGLI